MYQRLGPKGFVVLGFPCNQFGGQEPGTPAEIKAFTDGYGVTFPLFSKVDVNGPNTHPLFAYLKKQKGELLGDDMIVDLDVGGLLLRVKATGRKRIAEGERVHAHFAVERLHVFDKASGTRIAI